MRRLLLSLCLVAAASAPITAQTATLRSGAQGYSFGTPGGVGLESYAVRSTTLSVGHVLSPRFTTGGVFRLGSATVKTPALNDVSVSGPSDAELFAGARFGPVGMRGTVLLGLGADELSADALVASSLAASEVLPVSMRHWGSGGGFGLDVTLTADRPGYLVELFAALRRNAWFRPFEDDALEYRLGSSTRVGARASCPITALASAQLGVHASLFSSDETRTGEAYAAGARLAAWGAATFPLSGLSVLTRAGAYWRERGAPAPAPAVGVPVSLLGGAVTASARQLVTASVEARTVGRSVPLIGSVWVRTASGETDVSSSWMAGVGLGTDLELRPPAPGRWRLLPTAKLYRGHFTVAQDYESAASLWELELTLQWENR